MPFLTDHRGKAANRILDTLATRSGLFSVFGLLVLLCAGIGLYLQSVVVHLERNHEVFKDAQIRNGYVAMGDINRLVVAAQHALLAGEMTPELLRDFTAANDMLFVRIDNFRQVMQRGGEFSYGPDSIAALDRIVEIADDAVRSGFPDVEALVQDLLDSNDVARVNLVKFLDAVRRQGDLVLEQQSQAVRRQQIVVLSSLMGVTAVGLIALVFLRREVIGRNAREAAEQRVEFLAFFDPLTGLPNRVHFQERLQAALKARKPTALMYIDLDDFKLVNDTYGHQAGDEVLRRVGTILQAVAADGNGTAARLGGDEFAMQIASEDSGLLAGLCEKVIARVSEPFILNGETLGVGTSIGLATASQVSEDPDARLDALSRVTDFALYASKRKGRNQFTLYDQELEAKYLERRAMIEELPGAIANKHLEVHLQPKVHLQNRQVYGFEALVRWRRNGQIVAPGEFIQIAEESGLIVDIDNLVLNAATRLVSDWNRAHDTAYSVSVNLSTLHLTSRRVIERVQDALWQSGLPPHLLTLEITESTEIRDWKQAKGILDALRTVGCRISLDDFGTGFSSLAYLRSTKADELKIDKSLVDEVEHAREACLLLVSVLDIARNLDFQVVVEGIETERQCSILEEMGVHYGQGYLFGRPLPATEALITADATNAAVPSAKRRQG